MAKILVVEDDKDLNRFLSICLTNGGHEITPCYNGKEALDKKVKTPAEVFAYTFGITSTLIFGLGMCLAMKIIGDAMVLGIIIGVVGMGLILANYPLYKKVLLSRKKKYANEIISLTNEALNENK